MLSTNWDCVVKVHINQVSCPQFSFFMASFGALCVVKVPEELQAGSKTNPAACSSLPVSFRRGLRRSLCRLDPGMREGGQGVRFHCFSHTYG